MIKRCCTALLVAFCALPLARTQESAPQRIVQLPSSKILQVPAPGQPQRTNSFPTVAALSPDGKYLALLNNGRGTEESDFQQSIAILDLSTNQIRDFPDPRLKVDARQTYFLGLAFSADGRHLYASIASRTDPTGTRPESTGNGIAVYTFSNGRVTPKRFMPIPLQPLPPGKRLTRSSRWIPSGMAIPYPAGLAVVTQKGTERLLVADDLSDDALLLDAASGAILARYNLSTREYVPGSFPYAVVTTRDGKRGYCSLWNASQVAELDLEQGKIVRLIPLLAPDSPWAAGSHPTAMLLSPDESRLYVTLSNADAVAVVETATGRLLELLPTLLPGQQHGGTYPNALAQTADGKRLFVACASLDAVAIFDVTRLKPERKANQPLGFIPTEWYPTALAVQGDDLFVASGKGQGTGPNSGPVSPDDPDVDRSHPYIVSLIRGSIARLSMTSTEQDLAKFTHEVVESNLMRGKGDTIPFKGGTNPIRHVIYIIKENRTYDQVFGDLKPGDGDPSLCMYCEDVTPNHHKLARQFGILDNFYCSGEVSGDGHVWSMAAITSDYTEKTWQIAYRGNERTYDYEGEVAGGIPLEEGQPDVNEPQTGYIWTNVARHGLTHRNYGEFVATSWCDDVPETASPRGGTPPLAGGGCEKKFIHKGEPLPANVGNPHGAPSPWPWPVPIVARNVPTKPELRDNFDPHFPDFRPQYPDQLRVDEFMNEFAGFVQARKQGQGTELPQFVILRLGNDHTLGTRPGMPRPTASVADNDLALGRVVEAVSHSPYWEDTVIFVLEDDAQDGADHVDAHRSPALVISKYSPGSTRSPYLDHNFYTTVNMLHTMEVLLGLPPMNNNDAKAAVVAPLFSGAGNQPPYTADPRNLTSGMIYEMNGPKAPGAKESSNMDFSHADAVDAQKLNAILWRDRKGDTPMPKPRHRVIRE
ncbi:MAG TPA: beta-propeller fold lactonase family protein [Terriglobia bacterium]|jgi:DNA-binding beta-propeller fold protein YncE|nr:beta-propeller fold lactonase family protein [Terriglobia bacterium]